MDNVTEPVQNDSRVSETAEVPATAAPRAAVPAAEPTIHSRKPYVRIDGQVGPASELKLRPWEDREWALSLAATHSIKDAILEIKNRLGIDLKWEICYRRFCRWQQQQHRLEDYVESLQQRGEFGELADSAASEPHRHGHAALLMDEAVSAGDAKTFVGVARVSISESRLALHAGKIDVERQRLHLERRRLDWEIKKHRDATRAARPPKRRMMTAEERQARIRQILGTD
jgi:hypothetical protein